MSHFTQPADQSWAKKGWMWRAVWLAIVMMGALAAVKLVTMLFGWTRKLPEWPPRIY
jgi:hypothetical protein